LEVGSREREASPTPGVPRGNGDGDLLSGLRGPRARTIARWGAVTCAVIGGLVALGWVLGVVELVSVVPGYPPLHLNGALALLAAGAGLYGIAEDRRGWLLAGAVVTLLVGGLTLVEYVAGVDLAIDRLLLSDPTLRTHG